MFEARPSQDPPQRLIRASAGAGKTYQLTRHTLDLLRRGASIDSILATTFTRKAAGEILGRLIQALIEEAHPTQPPAEVKPGRPPAEMLDGLVERLHRVGVSTIDSFFHRLGGGFHLELGLPLEPRLIEEGSPEATRLRRQAIEAVLADAAVDDERFVALLNLLRRLHHGGESRSVTDAIDGIVLDHAELYRAAPQRDVWGRLVLDELMSEAQVNAALERWLDLESHLPTTAKGTPRKHWQTNWQKVVACVQQRQWDGLAEVGLIKKLMAGELRFDGTDIDEPWLSATQVWCEQLQAVMLERVQRQTLATFELMQLFDQQYEQLRHRSGVMLFGDMAHRLGAGLIGALSDDRRQLLQEIYCRLDATVTHLSLDEFQDTSLDQWRVLEPFVEEIGATADGSRSLFVVGDTKQAIYGWRGGCVELFDQVQVAAPGMEEESLAESWRSSQSVLDAVNEIFPALPRCGALLDESNPADTVAAKLWADAFEPHRAAKDLPGYVCFECSPLADDDAEPSREEGGEDDGFELPSSHERHVAERIAELHRQLGGRSIDVLTRGNRMVQRLLYELKKMGLPASGEGGNPIADEPAVAAVLSAMQMADHPRAMLRRGGARQASASAFHALNSPIGRVIGLDRIDDAGEVAQRIRRQLLEHGYAATVGQWVQQLAGDCDSAGLGKLTKLVELAEQYDQSLPPGSSTVLRPGRFVDFVEGTRVEEPDPSPIRVMTIHRSKGLEFDAVVLPELDAELTNRFGTLTYRPEPTGPIDAVFRGVRREHLAIDPALERAYLQARMRQRQEDFCLLYVAMTRARQGLHLIVKHAETPRLSKLRFAAILRDVWGDPEDEPITRGDTGWAGPPAGREAAEAPRHLELRLSKETHAKRHRPTVSPSQLHGHGGVSVRDLLALQPAAALQRGNEIHAAMEAIDYLTPEIEAAAEPGIAKMLDRPAVRRALSRRFDREELWRERPFVVTAAGRLIRGIFDRVAIAVDDDGRPIAAHLTDFKSDRLDAQDPQAVARRVAIYRPQIQAYRQSLEKLLKLDAGQITAELLFVDIGQAVAI